MKWIEMNGKWREMNRKSLANEGDTKGYAWKWIEHLRNIREQLYILDLQTSKKLDHFGNVRRWFHLIYRPLTNHFSTLAAVDVCLQLLLSVCIPPCATAQVRGSPGRLSPPLDAKGAIQTFEGIKKEHFDLVYVKLFILDVVYFSLENGPIGPNPKKKPSPFYITCPILICQGDLTWHSATHVDPNISWCLRLSQIKQGHTIQHVRTFFLGGMLASTGLILVIHIESNEYTYRQVLMQNGKPFNAQQRLPANKD